MFLCGGLLALTAVVAGVVMARRSHLTLKWKRDAGRVPVQIVHS
jgi:hypothetical protein